jgi:predicted lipid carrier protein YhbT
MSVPQEDRSVIIKGLEDGLLKGMTLSLKLAPLWLEAMGAAAVIAAMTELHPELKEKLAELDGKLFRFEATDIGKAFYLRILGTDISVVVHTAKDPDVTMRGTVKVLLDVFTGRVDPDTVFFSRRLEITGDTAAAVHLKNILATLG